MITLPATGGISGPYVNRNFEVRRSPVTVIDRINSYQQGKEIASFQLEPLRGNPKHGGFFKKRASPPKIE